MTATTGRSEGEVHTYMSGSQLSQQSQSQSGLFLSFFLMVLLKHTPSFGGHGRTSNNYRGESLCARVEMFLQTVHVQVWVSIKV